MGEEAGSLNKADLRACSEAGKTRTRLWKPQEANRPHQVGLAAMTELIDWTKRNLAFQPSHQVIAIGDCLKLSMFVVFTGEQTVLI